MNQLEINQVRSWMRKLARITNELNTLAFEMADFDGLLEKQLPEAVEKQDTTEIVKDRSVGVNFLMSSEVEPVADEKTLSKIDRWKSIVAKLDKEIQKAQTKEQAKSLQNKRYIYRGHITKAETKMKNALQGDTSWKSRAK